MRSPGNRTWLALSLIVLLGFTLRLVLVVQSPFFFDEYKLARIVDTMSFAPGSFNVPLHGDGHPPGQVYWSYLSTVVLGRNLIGYRAPALLAGTAAIIVVFALGRRLGGESAALVASALVATNEYLIGISRSGTDLGVTLFLSLLSMLALFRAAERATVARVVALGSVLGLAVLTRESAAFLLPPVVVLMVQSQGGLRWLRSRPPWCGLGAFVVAIAPGLAWSLFSAPAADDPSGAGLVSQASKLSIGSWSWAPLALYIRPIFYHLVEGHISEYVSMTTLPGVVILMAAAISVVNVRGMQARFMQSVGWGVFAFIAFFTTPRGEFWWADQSVFPFLILAALVAVRIPYGRFFAAAAILLIMLPASIRLVQVNDNFFDLDVGKAAPAEVERHRDFLAFTFLAFPERDQLSLYRFGGWEAPPLAGYRNSIVRYQQYLASGGSEVRDRVLRDLSAAAPSGATPRDAAWTEAELARLSVVDLKPR